MRPEHTYWNTILGEAISADAVVANNDIWRLSELLPLLVSLEERAASTGWDLEALDITGGRIAALQRLQASLFAPALGVERCLTALQLNRCTPAIPLALAREIIAASDGELTWITCGVTWARLARTVGSAAYLPL